MVQWAWQLLLALRKLAMAELANCGLSAGKAKKTKRAKPELIHTHTCTLTHTPAHTHRESTISQMYEANESSAKNWPKSLAGSAFCLPASLSPSAIPFWPSTIMANKHILLIARRLERGKDRVGKEGV